MTNTTDVPSMRGGSESTLFLQNIEPGAIATSTIRAQRESLVAGMSISSNAILANGRIDSVVASGLEPLGKFLGLSMAEHVHPAAEATEKLGADLNSDGTYIRFLELPEGAREWWMRMANGSASDSDAASGFSARGES